MESQGRRQESHQNSDKARADCFGGSAGIQHPRSDSPTKWQTHTTKIQIRQGICRQILRLYLCLPTKTPYRRRNGDGEARFRTLRRPAGSQTHPLSCRQWPIRGQRVHHRLQGPTARAILLRGKCPLPERDSRMPNKRSSRTKENIDAKCHEQIETHGPHLLMALRHVSRK